MSGGVDSSVAAALLQREGYDVVGCFMRLGTPGESLGLEADDGAPASACNADAKPLRIGKQGCCSINDAADARLVAAMLDVPFYVCNFRKEFGRIVDYFVDEYNQGRTPNPCVRCNDWLKFGRLHEYARQIDAQWVASGHYARLVREHGRTRLHRGVDTGKDQSYVLFGAPAARLDEMLLPIGDMQKSEVRAIARDLDLPVFDKPDSQEICFVPDNDYGSLVKRRTPDAVGAGPIVDDQGTVLGEHPGHQHFTVGQRRHIGVALGYPLYVVNKDAATNTVTVGPREALGSAGCTALEANWHADEHDDWQPCHAQIRSHAIPVPAEVRSTAPDTIEVRFDTPQDAVAPGQAVVCYDANGAVHCGGWINSPIAAALGD